jgi:hypothetical protein
MQVETYRDRLMRNIARYHAEQREELLSWRQAMYGEQAFVASSAYLQWLFEDSDHKDGPALWLYRREGRIEGQEGARPVDLKIGERMYDAAWALDLMVSPTVNGHGVGVVLAEHVHHQVGISMAIDVSAKARMLFLRSGWIDVGIVPLWIRPIRKEAMRKRLHPFIARIGQSVMRANRTLGDFVSAAMRVTVEPVQTAGDWVDQVWESASRFYPVIARRDRRWVEWRYLRFPLRRYELFRVRRGQETIGWMVLRIGTHDGLRTGFIVDFLCAPYDTYTVLSQAVSLLSEHGAARVHCVHTAGANRLPLFALGFVPRPSGWPLMIRAELKGSEREVLADQNAWFVTAGDADIDRPREGTVFAH